MTGSSPVLTFQMMTASAGGVTIPELGWERVADKIAGDTVSFARSVRNAFQNMILANFEVILVTALAVYISLGLCTCANRRARWVFWLWVPFLVISLTGSGFVAYCLVRLLGLRGQHGEAGLVG